MNMPQRQEGQPTTMTFDEADKIVTIYGKYLEDLSALVGCFFTLKLPGSVLPYPKDAIIKALNIMAEHYHRLGNTHAVELMEGVMVLLVQYVDDDEALLETAQHLSDPVWREGVTVKLLKSWQQDWTARKEELFNKTGYA